MSNFSSFIKRNNKELNITPNIEIRTENYQNIEN